MNARWAERERESPWCAPLFCRFSHVFVNFGFFFQVSHRLGLGYPVHAWRDHVFANTMFFIEFASVIKCSGIQMTSIGLYDKHQKKYSTGFHVIWLTIYFMVCYLSLNIQITRGEIHFWILKFRTLFWEYFCRGWISHKLVRVFVQIEQIRDDLCPKLAIDVNTARVCSTKSKVFILLSLT